MYHQWNNNQAGSVSDEALVGHARRDGKPGHARAALEELLERYTTSVYLHCRRVLGGRDEALDASQDVLVRVMERLDRFDPERARFAAWVFAITRNHCLNVLRAARVRHTDDTVDPDDLIGREESADGLVERADEKEKLMAFVRRVLDPIEQKVLWMRCVEGVSVDEITRLLGIESSSGARGVLQRARRKLRAAREEE